jgi:hypothetical protein
MTSSPAAGLPVVEFLTVPVRVWAEAREARRRRAAKTKRKTKRCETFEARWIDCAENSLTSRL